jgi:hypothetical protein
LVDITIPEPKQQYTKTPVTVTKVVDVIVSPEKVTRVPVDVEKPELGTVDVIVPAVWGKQDTKVQLVAGVGKTAKIVKYGELEKHLADAKLTASDAMAGVPVASVEAEIDVKEPVKYGEWGLGCPSACGRFFEMKVNDTQDGYVPKDSVAWTPTIPKVLETTEVDVSKYEYDEEGKLLNPDVEKVMKKLYLVEYDDGATEWVDTPPITYGYLDWRSGKGITTFHCDRCGEKITLTI